MGFGCAANFAAQPGVDRTPAKAVSAGTNRQGQGSRGSLVRDAGYCEPSPIRMAHAYDYSGWIRTVDATISRFLCLLSVKLDCYAAILSAQA